MGDQQESRGTQHRPALNLGLFIVAGMAIGTVVFAITGDFLWVAIGPSIGVLVGAVWQMTRQQRGGRG